MSQGKVREQIIETADALYYGRGIQAVGMDELRAASGVSLKRLYTLFSSKEEIVLAVLQYRHQMWTDGVTDAVNRGESLRARLLAVYDYLAEWFATDSFRGCGFINAFGELGAVSPAVAEVARLHKQSFQEYLSRLVAEAGGSEELAAQLAILAEGAQTTAAISGTAESAGQARRAAETLIQVSSAA
ncbi:TetR/AcrR family transcriptional regulator [Acaricomes phytoseiuli]|uniref:TetR/AcrR family transcriptional regulator n=1 Tax=Acaricomes phytoseiuli TaxID=291968 RepID=UPI0022213E5C|nr:TetR/AcrR family transcriptional regulator [Acaricomes phytoseiuli]MCW1250256.1 TetR/AcrR family transcriptional regulator [Acaricomes phytoseiuli]